MNSRALRAVLIGTVFSGFSVVVACVDDDPTITGNRPTEDSGAGDAGADVAALKPVVPLADFGAEGDVDDPRCRHCSTTLSTEQPRGTLCRHNAVGTPAKSSVQILNGVVDCACYDKCGAICGNYCSGGQNNNECQLCIVTSCEQQITACLDDK